MQCVKPIQVHEYLVPCGKCMACRISRTREWAIRMQHEASCHEKNIFLTLTYNDENLPTDMSLDKNAITLFIKRLRKDLGKDKIKYFACGEYGDIGKRPHYHLIIFGLGNRKDIFTYIGHDWRNRPFYKLSSWTKGYIYIGDVNYNSCRYVAGYIQKKLNGPMGKEEYGERLPPFSRQSNGLGKAHALKNKEAYIDKLSVTVKGVKHSLPRYYRKIYGDEITEERLLMEKISRENEFEEAMLQRHENKIEAALASADQKRAQREQKAEELKYRVNKWKPRDF